MEIWKNIIGYDFDTFYMVSNLGRVKRLSRDVHNQTLEEKILLPSINSIGYSFVKIRFKRKRYSLLVHRLVARSFLGDIDDLHVHHLDKNKQNNKLSNLQIIDHIKHVELHNKSNDFNKKEVNQYDLNGIFIKKYKSIKDAARVALNDEKKFSDISKVCRGKQKSAYGYIWSYVSSNHSHPLFILQG